MLLVMVPGLALLPGYFLMLYIFIMWFAIFRFAAGTDSVTGRELAVPLTLAGLLALSALAAAWVGPMLRFTVAGEEWTTGWGFMIADVLSLVFVVATAAVFVWQLRTRGKTVALGKVPAWAVLVSGAVGAAGLTAWLSAEFEFTPAATGPALGVIFGLALLGAASVVSAAVVRAMRSR